VKRGSQRKRGGFEIASPSVKSPADNRGNDRERGFPSSKRTVAPETGKKTEICCQIPAPIQTKTGGKTEERGAYEQRTFGVASASLLGTFSQKE